MKFLSLPDISLLPVFIASIVCFFLGTFWYSQALFGTLWMRYAGRTKEEISTHSMRYYGLAYSAIVLECFGMAYAVEFLNAETMSEGIVIGVILWLGFSVPTSTFSYMLEHRSRKILLIHSGYFLTMFVISATLLAMWR